MNRRLVWALFLLGTAGGQELKKASGHAMQYYLSLPQGWSSGKKWPVVVAIESANRDFQGNAAVFARARGNGPFIIVAPMVVTGGGAGFRSVPSYRYDNVVWSEIDRVGAFAFDQAGIAAAMADVTRLYGGEERYFLTGWEAGGHTVWAMLFQHPENLRAVAPVSTNYQGRWMTPDNFSSSPARDRLPVKVIQSAQLASAFLAQQTAAAIELAKMHGFGNVSLISVDAPHGPMAEEVLRFFASVLAQ